MLEFNVILGIDWLVAYYAILDCHLKMVKLNLLGEPFFLVQDDQSLTPYSFILVLKAKNIEKGIAKAIGIS